MKRLPIVSKNEPQDGRDWFQTLAERDGDPAVEEQRVREFEERPLEPPPGVDRRTFLTLMGASMALGGLAAGCRRPEEKIYPYTRRPEDLVDGKPTYYATSVALYGTAIGLLVESTDGRPTKIEGNPGHGGSFGGTTGHVQASVLDLYDPDRSRSPMKGGQKIAHEDAWAFLGDLGRALRARKGQRFAVLVEEHRSPTTAAALEALLRDMPSAKVYRFEPFGRENSRTGAVAAFGEPLDTSLDLAQADVVVVLDGDVLAMEGSPVRNSKGFAKRRTVPAEGGGGSMSRIYVAEPCPSVTGMAADHRLRIRAGRVVDLAKALAAALARGGVAVDPAVGALGGGVKLGEREQKWVDAAAKDLARAGKNGVVVAGQRQPPAVHALAIALNHALGAVGTTVKYEPLVDKIDEGMATLAGLVQAMSTGGVDTVLILGGNPAFSAPADMGFEAALKKVPTSIHVSTHVDETSAACTWHVPRAHFLESWSDTKSDDGTFAVVQPLIAPLYGGRTDAEVLERLVGGMRTPYELVMATWGTILGPADFDKRFRRVLHDGFYVPPKPPAAPAEVKADAPAPAPAPGPAGETAAPPDPKAPGQIPGDVSPAAPDASAAPAVAPPANPTAVPDEAKAPTSTGEAAPQDAPPKPEEPPPAETPEPGPGETKAVAAPEFTAAPVAQLVAAHQTPASEVEVVFAPDPHALDGRFANNGWMMELPDPIHKSTWMNLAAISHAMAQKLGVENGDHVDVTIGTRKVTIPVIVAFGHADDAVTLPVGLGRRFEGRVCKGVGADVQSVRTSAGWYAAGGTVQRSSGRTKPAITQGHFVMEGRPFVRTQTVEDHQADPNWAKTLVKHPPLLNLYQDWDYSGHKWGMTIDLTRCHGCSACIVACQAENNTPVLGVAAVLRSREMHWLRIDRYFAGRAGVVEAVDEAEAVPMPIPCQHCENAPCEQVCPVAATTHSPEGINEMTYNRCIGTKYCGNNCPYKVRRFNFFAYDKDIPDVQKLVLNPDVTVRSRGVMEKCTFCVQRVNQAKIGAKNAKDPAEKARILRSVITACAQACPTDAIQFGDLNDAGDRPDGRPAVAKLASLPRAYGILQEINTRPRVTYLGRITNPSPDLPMPAQPGRAEKPAHAAAAGAAAPKKEGH